MVTEVYDNTANDLEVNSDDYVEEDPNTADSHSSLI